MNPERKFFLILSPFFFALCIIYGLWSHFTEMAGFLGLMLSGLLALMVGGYLTITAKSYQNRPEDDIDGEIDSVEGDYGFFQPSSWWPFWLALSGAVCFLGLAVGWWLFVVGAFFGIPALIGWTFEAFRGQHAQ